MFKPFKTLVKAQIKLLEYNQSKLECSTWLAKDGEKQGGKNLPWDLSSHAMSLDSALLTLKRKEMSFPKTLLPSF